MKGVVFTEFLNMVEDRFGYDVVDQIIERSELANGGAFTTVGTYDHGEFLQLVIHLANEKDMAVPDVVRGFGEHLFGRFYAEHPVFFVGAASTFSFLQKVENWIHVEVLKLYPAAELPSIEYRQHSDDEMEITYRSSRPFADLAEGLLRGCAKHFGEPMDFVREDLGDSPGYVARFVLTRQLERIDG